MDIIPLQSGVTLLLEHIPFYQSACVGLFVDTGSRYETPRQAGIAHFIEHMLFKGTASRTAAELARQFDLIGGQFNAYTSKETTCFYAKVLTEHVGQAVSLLSDMLLHPLLAPQDIRTEQGVVLEEINMVEDSPDDLVVERLTARIWEEGIGRPILGTAETVSAFTGEDLRAFLKQEYGGANLVVSVAGAFDRDALCAQLTELFDAHGGPPKRPQGEPPVYRPAVITCEKDIEQNHLCFGFPSFAVSDERRLPLSVLSGILGDGMSSRLFQKLREQLGLVYTVYSFLSTHRDCGMFGIYAAQQKGNEEQAAHAILQELEALKREGVTEEELTRAKEMSKTGFVMSYESSYTRMSYNAREFLRQGYVRPPEQLLAEMDAVQLPQLEEVIHTVLQGDKLSLSVVGRLRKGAFYQELARLT